MKTYSTEWGWYAPIQPFTTDLMATGNVGKGGQQLMILFL